MDSVEQARDGGEDGWSERREIVWEEADVPAVVADPSTSQEHHHLWEFDV